MHILLTNDDGPPSASASPYIASFVRTLRSPPFNHKVSVVIPSQQRSWIGKAHLLPASTYALPTEKSKNEDITDVITPLYYLPRTEEVKGTIPLPSSAQEDGGSDTKQEGEDYWVLIPGTPAACAQLGIFHHAQLFPTSTSTSTSPPTQPPHPSSLTSPIDLVISGPNLGRNTSSAFALSSGTLGGALEAAICGVRAIAVSFAHFTRTEPQEIVDEACVLAARICEKLVEGWEKAGAEGGAPLPAYVGPEVGEGGRGEGRDVPDLYTVNVPLVEGIGEGEVRWTWMLNQKWTEGSLYQTIPGTERSEATGGERSKKEIKPPAFKWSPTFKDMWKTVSESPPGNDGLVVTQKMTSVTPLKASFQQVYGRAGFEGVFKL